MTWRRELTDQLQRLAPGGYDAAGPTAAEPTAWAAVALARSGRPDAARRAAEWLRDAQQGDGSVGVMADESTPAWPTSLAMLAWRAVQQADARVDYVDNVARAAEWALDARGRTAERKRQIGHDTTLVGWSWAADTHSWLEPTALFVAALRRAGLGAHPRVREGVRLMVDRLLPRGGCNYGNTLVLGQELLPHVQPTGVVLWSLAPETVTDPRLKRSIDYLEGALGADTPTASLAYGVLGLTAQGRRPAAAERWLEAAFERERARGPSPYKLALLAVALTAKPATPRAVAGHSSE